jgi:hypothetical protein
MRLSQLFGLEVQTDAQDAGISFENGKFSVTGWEGVTLGLEEEQ